MLALKLTLLPAFLLFLSLAGRWWGPAVAGWLAGFPIITAPILFVVCLQRGGQFAGAAATLSLASIASAEAYNFAYAWTCRVRRWPAALAAGLCAWLLVGAGLAQLPVSLPWTAAAAALAVAVGQRFLPRTDAASLGLVLRRRDVALRMVAGVALTLLVTDLSPWLGARWTGLLAAFPMLAVTLSVTCQRAYGAPFVVALLRGMVLGRFSYAAFCLGAALLVPPLGPIGFAPAWAAAALVQWGARVVSLRARPAAARS